MSVFMYMLVSRNGCLYELGALSVGVVIIRERLLFKINIGAHEEHGLCTSGP